MIDRPTRRGLILGLGAVICAPAIVRAASLMPVKAWRPVFGPGTGEWFGQTKVSHAIPYTLESLDPRFAVDKNGVLSRTNFGSVLSGDCATIRLTDANGNTTTEQLWFRFSGHEG